MIVKINTMKILLLCTGNSCRSQMAEAYLKSFDHRLEVYSAGTHPELAINSNTVEVMKENFIHLEKNKPKNVDQFFGQDFDYVITVCDNARDVCPQFQGNVKHFLHIGFDDPATVTGTSDEILDVYRKVRDEIKNECFRFFEANVKRHRSKHPE